ncbi:MAG: hypothetical protein HYY16_05275 [Planctomycetes bacterium]|nr:hypothetical protein [Planctomycetota bacterium]
MRRRERGLTLIEILLALMVLVLGVVGILALFPRAMQSSKESTEFTQGAILGESVANALTTAARFAQYDVGTGRYRLTMTHDSKNLASGALVYYQFLLPGFQDPMLGPSGTQWFHHPVNGAPIGVVMAGQPEDPQWSCWQLTGDPWTKAQFDQIKGTSDTTGTDGSEPLNQFAYSFDVRKINTLEYLLGTPKPTGGNYALVDLDPLVRVWEFRIHTFRLMQPGSMGAGGASNVAGQVPKKLIATLTTRITVR